MGTRQRGYALLLLLVIVAAASAYGFAERVGTTQQRWSRTQSTAAALATAKAALLGHAITYRDNHDGDNFGYLPCPDTAGAGVEQTPCGKAGITAIGLLPYKTLGLPELRDADGNCLWYAVAGSFKSNPRNVLLNWDTQGSLAVRDAGGRTLAAPDDKSGGAAAVVIAPGPANPGQRRGAGGCGDPVQAAAYLENQGDLFINGVATGAATSNDRVAWITPKEIFDAVVRRADFAAYLDEGIAAVRSTLGTQNPAAENKLPTKNPFGKQTASYNFYEAWRDQFRYFHCPSCYADAAGTRYDGLLLFAGRNGDETPRASTARNLTDYFEAALPLAQGGKAPPCEPAPARFDNASAFGRARDMALCLGPASP